MKPMGEAAMVVRHMLPGACLSYFLACLSAAILVPAAGCGVKYRSDPLPERLLVKQDLRTAWTYFPYGEAGIDYTFIGLGWIATFESHPRMTLAFSGDSVASCNLSQRWEPNSPGRALIEKDGWSVSDSTVCGILIGCADREDHYLPMQIHRARVFHGEQPWEIGMDPPMVLGDDYDRVVFVLHSWMYYQRLIGFDSHKYRFVKSIMGPMDHNCVHSFRVELLDLATGHRKVINGRYGGPGKADLTVQ